VFASGVLALMGCKLVEADDGEHGSVGPEALQVRPRMVHICHESQSLPLLLTKPVRASEATLIMDLCKSKFLALQPCSQKASLASPAFPCLLGHHDLAHQGDAKQGHSQAAAVAHSVELRPCEKSNPSHSSREFGFLTVDPTNVQSDASEHDTGTHLSSIQELWVAAGFGGSCVEFLAKRSDLKLTILVRPASLEVPQECSCLVGFLVYRINHAKRYMSIRRLAIMPEFRGQGYGREFIKWCIVQPGVTFLSLTSVSRSVGFYRAVGFRKAATWHAGGNVRPDDEPQLDQVYMEYHPKAGKGRPNKKRK